MADRSRVIVVASPHPRNDALEEHTRAALPGHRVVRIRRKEDLTFKALQELRPEYVFLAHWSWMLPADVYTNFECVVFHMSDVPYGRGGSPLQNLIVRGHTETVISALRCEKDVDAGPVYLKRPLSLEGTAEEILRRASDVVEAMMLEIVRTRPEPQPQSGDVVLFKRRRPQDGSLSALGNLSTIYDYIRMLDADGYPPAFLETEQLRLEFTGARLTGDSVVANVRIRKKDNDG